MTGREFVQKGSPAGFGLVSGAAIGKRAADSAAIVVEGPEVVSARGAASTEPEGAARIAAEMFALGGNAADAAAAACIAGCILQPHLVDLGGYVCCAVVLEGKTGRVWSMDANSVSPAASTERMFEILPRRRDNPGINEKEYACSVKDDANTFGPLSVGCPGTLAGIGTIWEKWGSLKWPQILAPSQRLMEEGFPYGNVAAAIAQKEAPIRRYEPSFRHLMPAAGALPKAGETWHRPDMEKTLKRLAAEGWQDFYRGEIGRQIADFVTGQGGILSRRDMAAFAPRLDEPYSTTYRGATGYTAVLPNGGMTCLEILNMLECFDPLPDDTVEYWHRLAEVQKLAWRNRLTCLADPAHVRVPLEKLLSKDYAAGRVENLFHFPSHVDRLVPPYVNAESQGTMHVSTADVQGNMVAVTLSHGGFFGSCLTVPGTGIILGHGMCRFDPIPGRVNSIGPGKRPLNNVSPMILRAQDRDAAMGLRGGRRIVNASAQIFQRMVDYGSDSLAAARAPRLHVQASEPGEVADALPESIRKALADLGHELNPIPDLVFGAHCAEVLKKEQKVRAGGNDWAAGAD